VHVTLKVRKELGYLRRREMFAEVRKAFAAGREKAFFRLCHFGVEHDHLHLVCEADGARGLGRGVQGLSVRIARGINRRLRRRGRVFADRYHMRVLETPRDVRNTLCYVVQNHRRHAAQRGYRLHPRWIDPCSSGAWLDGWKQPIDPCSPWIQEALDGPRPCAPATLWLLTTGWKKFWGALSTDDVPGILKSKKRKMKSGRGQAAATGLWRTPHSATDLALYTPRVRFANDRFR
jgi:REP element-mobilizing transposase RayT